MTEQDLIIDVGMHVGLDTRFYLAKGFKVVAVEANPELVKAAEEAFAPEIAEGRLRIFGVAVAEQRGTATLAIADESARSSLSGAEVRRAEDWGVRFRYVDVPAVPFEDILGEVGIPYYLKVDIEGLDHLCVRALRIFDDRPAYVSIESSISSAEPRLGFDLIFDELAEFWTLGYRSFKYVNQMRTPHLPNPPLEGWHFARTACSPGYASGSFGRETPGRWERIETALPHGWALRVQNEFGAASGRWASLPPGALYRAVRSRLFKRPTGFFDLHARLDTVE
jgi:FkbM family methyltransferase